MSKKEKIITSEWIEKTNAVGIYVKQGKYGGTYAHKDIAFEFGSAISSVFRLFLIKEFQRLKEDEQQQKSLEWNLQRTLSKINYRIHTDTIKIEYGKHQRAFDTSGTAAGRAAFATQQRGNHANALDGSKQKL